MAGVHAGYATLTTSPVRNPESGTLLRLKPDLSGGEIFADGFRNAYDFDFSPQGDILTFDSDGERDVSLPWYEPTRVFLVTPRSHAGWISRSWKHPDTFPDMPPLVAEAGRGSPTGVVCYRHTVFPKKYQGALFVLDWTFGRILALRLQQDGSVVRAQPELFASGAEHFGFAPTDIAVGPDGHLYVTVGGRGTQGSVFRIFPTGTDQEESDPPALPPVAENETEMLTAVLQAPQPGASWSRTRWLPLARRLPKDVLEQAALDASRPDNERIRAIEVLTELHGGLSRETVMQLAEAPSAPVRARAVWSLGRVRPASPDGQAVQRYLQDPDPRVLRSALEALSTATDGRTLSRMLPSLLPVLASDDAGVRAAAATVCSRLDDTAWKTLREMLDDRPAARVTAEIGRRARKQDLDLDAIQAALPVLKGSEWSVRQKLDAVRLVQMALGDAGPSRGRAAVFDSVAPRIDLAPHDVALSPLVTLLSDMFPSGHADLDRELLRLLGMLSPVNRDLLPAILDGITADSHPTDDIHRLMVLARIEVERTFDESTATAAALVGLEDKLQQRRMKQDANWDDRIGELYTRLCQVDPALRTVIVDQPGFGRPGHVLLLSEISPDRLQQALDRFVEAMQRETDFEWSNDIVFALAESRNPQHRMLLRGQLDNRSVQGAVLMVLAENPQPDDRSLFVSGLAAVQPDVVESCLNALTRLSGTATPEELFALLSAARRLMHSPKEYSLRETAVRLLQQRTGRTFGFVFGEPGHRPQPQVLQQWGDWLRAQHPDFAPPGSRATAVADFLDRLDDIPWDRGDAQRGERLSGRLGCARCHGGRRALGPDLQGVARRFSRSDLFAAIVDPDRDVSPRYQTTSIVTRDGNVWTGLIVYESVDGLLLRDANLRTWRIEASEIEDRIRQPTSLMPSDLLQDLTPEDIADLNAWLQNL